MSKEQLKEELPSMIPMEILGRVIAFRPDDWMLGEDSHLYRKCGNCDMWHLLDLKELDNMINNVRVTDKKTPTPKQDVFR